MCIGTVITLVVAGKIDVKTALEIALKKASNARKTHTRADLCDIII
jgi:hypothetical protein